MKLALLRDAWSKTASDKSAPRKTVPPTLVVTRPNVREIEYCLSSLRTGDTSNVPISNTAYAPPKEFANERATMNVAVEALVAATIAENTLVVAAESATEVEKEPAIAIMNARDTVATTAATSVPTNEIAIKNETVKIAENTTIIELNA
ncbi:MAG: hypothetical protein AAF716_13290 [Cyanobacteria bacterium P01_D01_bin.1]